LQSLNVILYPDGRDGKYFFGIGIYFIGTNECTVGTSALPFIFMAFYLQIIDTNAFKPKERREKE
jgi:hypothetical protein